MLQFVYWAHWIIPWFILILGMYLIVSFVRGYIDKRSFTTMEDRLFGVFRYSMVVQGATGFMYFSWSGFVTGYFPLYRIAHGVVMFIAGLILGLSPRWDNVDDATRYLNLFYVLLASFLIMLVGLGLVPASTTGR